MNPTSPPDALAPARSTRFYVYLQDATEPASEHDTLALAAHLSDPVENAMIVKGGATAPAPLTSTEDAFMAVAKGGEWHLTSYGVHEPATYALVRSGAASVCSADPAPRRARERAMSYQEWLTGDPDRHPPVAAALANLHDDVTDAAVIPGRRRAAATDWLVGDEAVAKLAELSGRGVIEPRHGTTRHQRDVVESPSYTHTVNETYCRVCAAWVASGSIVQHLCCKFCTTSWSATIEAGSVRRLLIPTEWTRPDGVRWPTRIDVHPLIGGWIARFRAPDLDETEGPAQLKFETLGALCSALCLDETWVETLDPLPMEFVR